MRFQYQEILPRILSEAGCSFSWFKYVVLLGPCSARGSWVPQKKWGLPGPHLVMLTGLAIKPRSGGMPGLHSNCHTISGLH